MAKVYTMIKDDLGRFQTIKRIGDPAVIGVNALIEGLRAGQASIEQARYEVREALKAEKVQRRRETRTKLLAFGLFDLMSGALVYVMYAGIVG